MVDASTQDLAGVVSMCTKAQVSDPAAYTYVRKSLDSARQTITDLVSPLDGDDLEPGDLVRSAAAGRRRDAGVGSGHGS